MFGRDHRDDELYELKGKVKTLTTEVDYYKTNYATLIEQSTRYKQLSKFRDYDLSTPEGLINYKEILSREARDLSVAKETVALELKLKDKDIENLKDKLKEREERIEFLKSLLRK